MIYKTEIQRIDRSGEKDEYEAEFLTVEGAYGYIFTQYQHGPFRAWVNNRALDGIYNAPPTLEEFEKIVHADDEHEAKVIQKQQHADHIASLSPESAKQYADMADYMSRTAAQFMQAFEPKIAAKSEVVSAFFNTGMSCQRMEGDAA